VLLALVVALDLKALKDQLEPLEWQVLSEAQVPKDLKGLLDLLDLPVPMDQLALSDLRDLVDPRVTLVAVVNPVPLQILSSS
jgi:hypothetical protein